MACKAALSEGPRVSGRERPDKENWATVLDAAVRVTASAVEFSKDSPWEAPPELTGTDLKFSEVGFTTSPPLA